MTSSPSSPSLAPFFPFLVAGALATAAGALTTATVASTFLSVS